MSWLWIIMWILLTLSIIVFIIGMIWDRHRKKKNASNIVKTNSSAATIKGQDSKIELPATSEVSKGKTVTTLDKIQAKFTFSEVPKRYYLIQSVSPIGTAKRYGDKFHAGVIESKGKLWLENQDYGFFVEMPDERNLIIIDNQEGYEYKKIGSQWLLQGYNLANGQGNNVYTVDEQSDFLRTLEAKFWQYQGKKNMNKDKWSFWGLVVLGLLIVFAMGMNTYQTNKFMGNVNDLITSEVLDDTDKALILEVLRNQEKLSNENIALITTIKEKGLNIKETVNNQEGIVFK